jgi:hypothetical protein
VVPPTVPVPAAAGAVAMAALPYCGRGLLLDRLPRWFGAAVG